MLFERRVLLQGTSEALFSLRLSHAVSDRRPLSLARLLIDVSPERPAFPAAVVDLSANSMDAHASTSKHIAAAVLHQLLFPAMMRCPLP